MTTQEVFQHYEKLISAVMDGYCTASSPAGTNPDRNYLYGNNFVYIQRHLRYNINIREIALV